MNPSCMSGRDDSGYSLLELLAYLFILAIIINVSLSLMLMTKRLTDVGELAFERIRIVEEIGREFRSAIEVSDAVVAEADGLHSNGSRLLLSNSGTNGSRHTVIQTTKRGDYLLIEEYAVSKGETRLENLKSIPLPGVEVRFEYSTPDPEAARWIRLVVDIDNEGTPNTIPAVNVFVASLRGWSE